jgi:hypothetical protein
MSLEAWITILQSRGLRCVIPLQNVIAGTRFAAPVRAGGHEIIDLQVLH